MSTEFRMLVLSGQEGTEWRGVDEGIQPVASCSIKKLLRGKRNNLQRETASAEWKTLLPAIPQTDDSYLEHIKKLDSPNKISNQEMGKQNEKTLTKAVQMARKIHA